MRHFADATFVDTELFSKSSIVCYPFLSAATTAIWCLIYTHRLLLIIIFRKSSNDQACFLYFVETLIEHVEMSPKHFTMATIVLFSASGQTHWVTVILHSVFWISTEVVTTLFSCGHWHGWCHMKLLLSQHTFNGHHTSRHLQCHFIQSYVHRMHVCLVATCHLHIWQNDQDLFYAIAVTQGWNGYQNKSPAQKVDLGEENPRDLSTMSPALYHWAILLPTLNRQQSPPLWHTLTTFFCDVWLSLCYSQHKRKDPMWVSLALKRNVINTQ